MTVAGRYTGQHIIISCHVILIDNNLKRATAIVKYENVSRFHLDFIVYPMWKVYSIIVSIDLTRCTITLIVIRDPIAEI